MEIWRSPHLHRRELLWPVDNDSTLQYLCPITAPALHCSSIHPSIFLTCRVHVLIRVDSMYRVNRVTFESTGSSYRLQEYCDRYQFELMPQSSFVSDTVGFCGTGSSRRSPLAVPITLSAVIYAQNFYARMRILSDPSLPLLISKPNDFHICALSL
jgi:hypothetical protein